MPIVISNQLIQTIRAVPTFDLIFNYALYFIINIFSNHASLLLGVSLLTQHTKNIFLSLSTSYINLSLYLLREREKIKKSSQKIALGLFRRCAQGGPPAASNLIYSCAHLHMYVPILNGVSFRDLPFADAWFYMLTILVSDSHLHRSETLTF